MPDIFRIPTRMDCLGLDLVHPVDRMPPGAFPYLFNCRVIQEGRIDARPGYDLFGQVPDTAWNSIRRLNDVSKIYAPSGYTYIGGNSTKLYAGQETGLAVIDDGYSGLPLSLLTFRPENSPVAWMYVYDQNKLQKVRPDGTVRAIGATPPGAPQVEYGVPASVEICQGDFAGGWQNSGGATNGVTQEDRTNGEAPTIGSILYNSGTTGWCCMFVLGTSWVGERMQVKLSGGGGEIVTVREIHPAITQTTLESILYDAGTTGLCSAVLVGSPTGLERNSLIRFGSELIRVLSVNQTSDGTAYSIRCSTVSTHTAGETVIGLISWYVWTAQNHVAHEAITSIYIQDVIPAAAPAKTPAVLSLLYAANGTVNVASNVVTQTAGAPFSPWPSGTPISINGTIYTILVVGSPNTLYLTSSAGTIAGVPYIVEGVVASKANGRPISAANDYMHLSFYCTDATKLVSVAVKIDVDALTTSVSSGSTAGNAFTNNYYQWDFAAGQGQQIETGWNELVVAISSATRYGNDLTQSFSDIRAISISAVTTGATTIGFDDWYFFGTYGPTVQPNSPTGIFYVSTNRDSSTGAASVPGPAERSQFFPLREDILVTPKTSTQTGVDSLDIYRQGGTLTSFTYVGTVSNNVGSPVTFSDTTPDAELSTVTADYTLLQPWPILDLAWSGTVDVVGTSVVWRSGTQFGLTLNSGTEITINGIAYQTYGQPKDSTHLEIQNSAGTQTGVSFLVASPIIAGQSLPLAFGPLEGPFSPVIFGLGDPKNAGTLYYANTGNADSSNDTNTLEICPPGEPLVTGEVWNGLCFAGSHDNVYLVRYSYLATIGASANLNYQFSRLPSASGFWSRWAICRGPDGVYALGRDGIYKFTDQGGLNISDAALYPLFPHDGQPATQVNSGGNIILPVDMTKTQQLRLSCCDQDIYFDYIDVGNNAVCLRYEIAKKRWFLHSYGDNLVLHYLIEASISQGANVPTTQQIIMLGQGNGKLYLAGGNQDDSKDIQSLFLTPSFDGGDERGQKLYVDSITDADGTGVLAMAHGYQNSQQFSPVLDLALSGARIQQIDNISSLADLSLYRNISVKYAWTGGPDGPRVYAWEPSGYLQPYLSSFLVTQQLNLSFPGWKHHRRLYAGLISNNDVVFTIKTQDGRSFSTVVPNTQGRYRIWPLMIQQPCKDLAFAYQLDGKGQTFALFPEAFTLETKEWVQPQYIELAVFKT